ncbi:MAG: hypothetical protein Q9187_009462, partial [Circinaria calcarea]
GPKGDAWSGVPRRGDALGRSVTGFGSVKEEDEEEVGKDGKGDGSMGAEGRKRAVSGVGSVKEDDDEDRVDARNAASRLAASTF